MRPELVYDRPTIAVIYRRGYIVDLFDDGMSVSCCFGTQIALGRQIGPKWIYYANANRHLKHLDPQARKLATGTNFGNFRWIERRRLISRAEWSNTSTESCKRVWTTTTPRHSGYISNQRKRVTTRFHHWEKEKFINDEKSHVEALIDQLCSGLRFWLSTNKCSPKSMIVSTHTDDDIHSHRWRHPSTSMTSSRTSTQAKHAEFLRLLLNIQR